MFSGFRPRSCWNLYIPFLLIPSLSCFLRYFPSRPGLLVNSFHPFPRARVRSSSVPLSFRIPPPSLVDVRPRVAFFAPSLKFSSADPGDGQLFLRDKRSCLPPSHRFFPLNGPPPSSFYGPLPPLFRPAPRFPLFPS